MTGLVAPLFVPGNRPDRARKARARGASAIILDLEDAVPTEGKATARADVARLLSDDLDGVAHLVRMNPISSGALAETDVAALGPALASLHAVVVPKVVSPAELHRADELITAACGRSVSLIATIESAAGIREAYSIAGAGPMVATLLFGVADLSAELGITATAEGTELLHARSAVVLACAAAGLAKPLDGPHLNVADPDGLNVSTRHARALGYGGKVTIHPDQLAGVRAAFAPTPAELAWAREVLAAFESVLQDGVGVVKTADGTFVDLPVAEQARRILAAADSTTIGAGS